MKTKTSEALLQPLGEGELDFKFLPAGGQFHLRGNDEVLTAYGGLVTGSFMDLPQKANSWLELIAAFQPVA